MQCNIARRSKAFPNWRMLRLMFKNRLAIPTNYPLKTIIIIYFQKDNSRSGLSKFASSEVKFAKFTNISHFSEIRINCELWTRIFTVPNIREFCVNLATFDAEIRKHLTFDILNVIIFWIYWHMGIVLSEFWWFLWVSTQRGSWLSRCEPTCDSSEGRVWSRTCWKRCSDHQHCEGN